MKKEWVVTVKFKYREEDTVYIFEGHQEEARRDAYLSYPQGSLRNVIVKPRFPELEEPIEESNQIADAFWGF